MSKRTDLGRQGSKYLISTDQIEQYRNKGYLVLKNFLKESELKELEEWFDHFIQGKEPGMKRDFCDMSQSYDTPPGQFQLVNAMLPSFYRPELANNIFYQVAKSVVEQLYTEGTAEMDYEQFLAKKPRAEKAEFAMHQDLGYWPKTTKTWTATFSLALSDSSLEHGCLQVIPGSNKEPELRKHRPKISKDKSAQNELNRESSHALELDIRPDDKILPLPVKRGSVTVHDERIIHGSGGNTTNEWRKTYVMAFRDIETIEEERKMGFTHSHNDKLNWGKVL